MRSSVGLLSLPASLLLLISSTPAHTSVHDQQWPYNLPIHVKYYPEDEHIVRRDLVIQHRLAYQFPAGVQKMSCDEGEKFFMTYWNFDCQETESEGQGILLPDLRERAARSRDPDLWRNASILQPLQPPFLLHTEEQNSLNPHVGRFLRSPRAVFPSLEKRAFQCPTGTSNCTSIGRPNSCCATGETCQLITNTGLGDVGCCGQGQTCSGQVTTCDAGYTSCPNNPGGGCCIPGYSCVDVGCAISSTATVIITPTVTASPSSSSTSSPPATSSLSSSIIAPIPFPSSSPPSSSTQSSSSSPSPSSSTSTTTTTSTTTSTPTQALLTCSPGYHSCPATLGGGCCPTDRACGATECPASTNSSVQSNTFIQAPPSSTSSEGGNPAAPVRPTSIASSPITTITTATGTAAESTLTGTACPTGFYQCSAYYSGGCCRVGRDCGMTSCPTTASTSVLNSNGVTVVAPAGSGVTGVSVTAASAGATGTATTTVGGASGNGNGGSCAQGWFSCAASVGGGCCPSGYGCGSSCSASVSGGGSVGKIAASGAGGARADWVGWMVVVGVAVGAVGGGMVWS